MHGFFLALTIISLIAIIIGFIKPRTVLWWWGTKKRFQINVLKYYGIGFVVFLILFGLTSNNLGTSAKEDSVGKTTITESEKTLTPTEKAVAEKVAADQAVAEKAAAEKVAAEKAAASEKYIIGANKEQIRTMFSGWEYVPRYEQNVDPNAMKFENSDLMVVIDFDSQKVAEGVSFLSNGNLGDMITGKGSYVDIHYNELVQWATGGKNLKVVKGNVSQYPVEIYIGNYHEW